VKDLRKTALCQWLNQATPYKVESLHPISGDASFRRYFRFEERGTSYIAVDAPPEHEDTAMFLAVQGALSDIQIKVPNIYAVDIHQGFLCIEDFGDDLLIERLKNNDNKSWYQKALSIIPQIQEVHSTSLGNLPSYNEKMVRFEMNLFEEWFLKRYLSTELENEETVLVERTVSFITEQFIEQPQVGVHRDFHSKNLMVLQDDNLGVIDFQGAVIGPITYDAVSLLKDCYIDCPADILEDLLEEWHNKHIVNYTWQQFRYDFDITALQRLIKVAGIFARLGIRDNKVSYLAHIPKVIESISNIMGKYPQFTEFSAFLNEIVIKQLEQIINE
jgi:aminoglycoside/choline kinase family phosphotransferase